MRSFLTFLAHLRTNLRFVFEDDKNAQKRVFRSLSLQKCQMTQQTEFYFPFSTLFTLI